MRRVLVVLALALSGCASVSETPKPNIFYPLEFYEQSELWSDRYVGNWEIALQHPEVRKSLKARLLLGADKRYRVIDGDELVQLSYERPVIVRNTNGGDQNPDGTWNDGCAFSFFQNRFYVYEWVQKLRPEIAVVEIHKQDNTGHQRASKLLEKWVLQTAKRLHEEDPQKLWDFYFFWGITSLDWETKEWGIVAHTGEERLQAIRSKIRERGWTPAISSLTPFAFLLRDGKPVKHDGQYAFVGSLYTGYPQDVSVVRGYTEGYFGAEDRKAYRQTPLTPEQIVAGKGLARFIIHELGL